jgi:hypothetical protein
MALRSARPLAKATPRSTRRRARSVGTPLLAREPLPGRPGERHRHRLDQDAAHNVRSRLLNQSAAAGELAAPA